MALTTEMPREVVVAMAVRMLKNPTVTMEQILEFTDSIIVEASEVASAEVAA